MELFYLVGLLMSVELGIVLLSVTWKIKLLTCLCHCDMTVLCK